MKCVNIYIRLKNLIFVGNGFCSFPIFLHKIGLTAIGILLNEYVTEKMYRNPQSICTLRVCLFIELSKNSKKWTVFIDSTTIRGAHYTINCAYDYEQNIKCL